LFVASWLYDGTCFITFQQDKVWQSSAIKVEAILLSEQGSFKFRGIMSIVQ
tara:strand:+ start:553 stop:705 length:153 start_codon:yes stop_codon:yes gene_type:complete